MKNNQNDIEPAEEPVIYKNFDYKLLVISILIVLLLFALFNSFNQVTF